MHEVCMCVNVNYTNEQVRARCVCVYVQKWMYVWHGVHIPNVAWNVNKEMKSKKQGNP